MLQLIYRIIYSENINYVLRNINKLLSPFLPNSIRIPPSGIIKAKNSNGNSIKFSLNQSSGFGSVIFWDGYQTFEYTAIFIKLIKKVHSFYDIGANLGYYTLIAASENSGIRIVCFEPATGPAFYLNRNITINGISNITVEAIALSNIEGTIDFYEIRNKKYKFLEHCLAGESNAGSITTGRNFHISKVRTTTLDQYVATNNEREIDLIKMDTEGTEHLILSKSTMVLTQMKPIIICETLFNVIEEQLEEIMTGFGYEFYNHIGTGLKKVTSIKRTQDDGVRNCFFVHPSKKHLIEEFISVE
ncbi:MAG: FkbM family methyltransferase [Flavobacteriales bacterium]|nr:FkbM family methyltransferase [Flavobacteriales bacterium]